jgi:Eco57I restriction-modification methylase/MmeI, target recognition domain
MSYDNHHDWLSLIEISGPFLAVPVLKEAFPQGLEELDAGKRKRLRQAYEEWREALELEDAQFAELHLAWIDEVLSRGLELDEDGKGDVLKRADWCAANLQANLPEHGVALSPDLAVIDEQRANKPLLLIQTYAQVVDLDATLKQDGWAATPADRMVQLCRSLGCRLGLVTNGERWMLVDAPVGAVTTFASWYARIWGQEPITLQAFVHLLGIRRFFVDESEQLPELFDRSLKFQDEVTDALGEQVRRAVEVLIQTLDKADQDRNRELLHDVKEPELYEAALTVMMRLVFLLSAEERGLLLMGDERYEANYALSTLRMQLRKESEEILERRWDAWSRLLAIFRAVYGGIEHENLRLPALGGSLFDPDRFPFLEGRAKGSNWRSDAAKPLPIDNRTVLLLLEAIQQFQGRTLSYRALDVEQIGYVYEGLLERTVRRTNEVTLELDATKSAKTPWVKLAELDSARLDGVARLAELLQERSGSSASRVRNDLAKPVDDTLADRLLTACLGETKLRDRVKPYAHLLRTDPWGYPLVYPTGAFIVTTGSDRRETGTHYTPKSLTEAIVTETLTPVAYVGPAEGTPRDQWVLKSPAELLDLKICDPAMGSGAFLVQACRWLSDRLVESWALVEASGKSVSVDGEVQEAGSAKEPLPRDSEARTVIARRLIAERCLYGVDLNPLAVELAKLSIWLVTLAKGRPFGFLDHNLRSGDSLLGLHKLDQLTKFSLNPDEKRTAFIFASDIEVTVKEAIEIRRRLRDTPIRDIRDIQNMERLDQEARQKLEKIEHLADAMIGELLVCDGNQRALDAAMDNLSIWATSYIDGEGKNEQQNIAKAKRYLSIGLSQDEESRSPFHWALEFPEVFEQGGFDGIVGNPPFLGGKRIATVLGEKYQNSLKTSFEHSKGAADLSAFFFRRAQAIVKNGGGFCFIATNTIAQGDTRKVGLEHLIEKEECKIFYAKSSFPWPGKAGVHISIVGLLKGDWNGTVHLDGLAVENISSALENEHSFNVFPLKENKGAIAEGIKIHGNGFLVDERKYYELIDQDPKNKTILQIYLGGEDVTNDPSQRKVRYVINFRDFDRQKAEEFSDLFNIVTQEVKPYRDKLKGQIHEHRYWIFWDRRELFFNQLDKTKSILVCSGIAKYLALEFVQPDAVISQRLKVFKFQDYAHFSILQSNLHECWVRRNSSTLETRLSYSNKDAFATFPFCDITDRLEGIGKEYYAHRKEVMNRFCEGLTSVYNRLHDPEDISDDCVKFRTLQAQMDEAVVAAYGWNDIDLNHGFHETKQGMRFTISGHALSEILRRLLRLNHKRYEEEVSAGFHGKSTPKKIGETRKRGAKTKNAKATAQSGFDFGKVDE